MSYNIGSTEQEIVDRVNMQFLKEVDIHLEGMVNIYRICQAPEELTLNAERLRKRIGVMMQILSE